MPEDDTGWLAKVARRVLTPIWHHHPCNYAGMVPQIGATRREDPFRLTT
ncbi:MAG: hypothetical protein ACTHLH_08065 [Solirubrobacterales bacterium]